MTDRVGTPGSVRATRFDELYRRSIDPWHFRTCAYERGKYAATLAALPAERYRRALEIGCSIGELTCLLSKRANETIGLDISRVAIDEARRSHAREPGLEFMVGEVPRDWPSGRFDLIVLSEVLYFLSIDEIDVLVERIAATLEPGGQCVSVCWLGPTDRSTDLDGDESGARLVSALERTTHGSIARDAEASFRERDYRLDVLTRTA